MSEIKALERLREFASECAGGLGGDFLSITADEIEAEIERDYMKLPVDADGVPVHVGDTMTLAHGKSCEVVAVSETQFTANKLGSPKVVCHANLHRHVKPDTLKELLDDVSKGIICYPRERVTGYLEDNNSIGEAVMLDVRDRLRELLGGDAS